MEQQIKEILGKLIKLVVVEVGEKYYGDEFIGESHNNLLTKKEATDQLLTLIANHDKEMLAKIEGLDIDRWTEHNADMTEVVEEHATVKLDDIKSLYGGKDE